MKQSAPKTEVPAIDRPIVFFLDSNILQTIFNSDEELARFIGSASKANATIVLPSDVMMELCTGGVEKYDFARFQKFVLLYEKLGPKVRFGHLVGDMIKLEQKALGSIRVTPTIPDGTLKRSYLSRPELFKDLYPEMLEKRRELTTRRESRLKADEEGRKVLAKKINQGELVATLQGYNTQTLKDHVSLIDRDMESYISIKKLLKKLDSEGFLVTSAFAHLMLVRYLLVVCETPDEVLKDLVNLHKNNWNDLAIAATAAYSDYLVTDDNNLRSLTNFIFGKGAIRFQGLSHREFKTKLEQLAIP